MTTPPDTVKVPREATPEMYEAARTTYLLGESPFFEKIWAAMLAAAPPQPEPGWQPIKDAPKDRTIIWAQLRSDIYPALKSGRPDLKPWNGLQLPLRHPGLLAEDDFDMGWNVAAPVGHGGFPDEWIAGWMPLPA